MTYRLIHGDARHVSDHVEANSVDLIVTSPPYFALRSYRDGGEHYDGQIGSEPTPREFVDALIACTADWVKVLKPSGSIFVNLGDKYAGSGGGHNNAGVSASKGSGSTLGGGRQFSHKPVARDSAPLTTRRNAPDRYNQASDGMPAKSLMGLPWRYANRCVDDLGLILRAEIVWSKPNGLPESVTDRVRRSHEQIFHFTQEGRYFAAIDEVREEHDDKAGPPSRFGNTGVFGGNKGGQKHDPAGIARGDFPKAEGGREYNPLGKVPGSVWVIPSEPLTVPDHLDVDHFAAFPSELPRRCILGWAPTGYCTGCGEARRAVVVQTSEAYAAERARVQASGVQTAHEWGTIASGRKGVGRTTAGGFSDISNGVVRPEHTITGYRCACPTTDASTRPAVVLDPFVGTGTTTAVAHHLGRHGIGIDLSRDYLRLAEWRIEHDDRLRDKVLDRSDLPRAPTVRGQLDLFDGGAA